VPATAMLSVARVAERAERSVKLMAAMLEDLSEAASLETRGAELRRAPCELTELFTRRTRALSGCSRIARGSNA
jgi:hypothetical protein